MSESMELARGKSGVKQSKKTQWQLTVCKELTKADTLNLVGEVIVPTEHVFHAGTDIQMRELDQAHVAALAKQMSQYCSVQECVVTGVTFALAPSQLKLISLRDPVLTGSVTRSSIDADTLKQLHIEAVDGNHRLCARTLAAGSRDLEPDDVRRTAFVTVKLYAFAGRTPANVSVARLIGGRDQEKSVVVKKYGVWPRIESMNRGVHVLGKKRQAVIDTCIAEYHVLNENVIAHDYTIATLAPDSRVFLMIRKLFNKFVKVKVKAGKKGRPVVREEQPVLTTSHWIQHFIKLDEENIYQLLCRVDSGALTFTNAVKEAKFMVHIKHALDFCRCLHRITGVSVDQIRVREPFYRTDRWNRQYGGFVRDHEQNLKSSKLKKQGMVTGKKVFDKYERLEDVQVDASWKHTIYNHFLKAKNLLEGQHEQKVKTQLVSKSCL